MNLTLVFSRKYRWPGQYFSVWCLGNSQKLLTTNQFLVITIFFAMMNVSFFDLRFDLFSIIVKEVNQIGNNIVCFVSLSLYLYVLDKLETLPQLISFKFSLVPIKKHSNSFGMKFYVFSTASTMTHSKFNLLSSRITLLLPGNKKLQKVYK